MKVYFKYSLCDIQKVLTSFFGYSNSRCELSVDAQREIVTAITRLFAKYHRDPADFHLLMWRLLHVPKTESEHVYRQLYYRVFERAYRPEATLPIPMSVLTKIANTLGYQTNDIRVPRAAKFFLTTRKKGSIVFAQRLKKIDPIFVDRQEELQTLYDEIRTLIEKDVFDRLGSYVHAGIAA